MPKRHKIYPNCIWHVPPEWHSLNFDSALLTKVDWIYATRIVRFCVPFKFPIYPNLLFTNKRNLQIEFGYRDMASPYEPSSHHSLTNNNPLLKELLSYLPT